MLPLLQRTVPVFATRTYSSAVLGPMAAIPASAFVALAVQNPQLSAVEVTLRLLAEDASEVGVQTLSLPSGGRISRDLLEWFGVVVSNGYTEARLPMRFGLALAVLCLAIAAPAQRSRFARDDKTPTTLFVLGPSSISSAWSIPTCRSTTADLDTRPATASVTAGG